MEPLERRVQRIEERNRSVESDKAWETSWARKILIAFCTYIAIGLFMWAIGVENPFVNSIVPTAGFMLSTLTMPFFKELWLRHRKKEE